MIIIQLAGGLGNQLQQFSLYKKLQTLGKDVKLDISWFENEQNDGTPRNLELNYFENLKFEVCTEDEKRELIGRKSLLVRFLQRFFPILRRKFRETPMMYNPKIFTFENMYIEGYFACEKYYVDIIPLLQDIIVFPLVGQEKNLLTARMMQSEGSVSLHIRRGDYLNPENKEIFENICTNDYYKSAMEYMLQKYPQSHFYIFSDDLEYVRQKFVGEQFTIVDWNTGKDSFYDMYLMSQCKHNICANSTFSFWGARLNRYAQKRMIRPLKQKNSNQYEPELMCNLWKEWILIDEKGKIFNAKID